MTAISSTSVGISGDFADLGANSDYRRMKTDPYCQRQNCSPLNIVFSGE